MHDGTVSESSLEPAWQACPVCLSAARKKRELTLQRKPLVELVRCSACSASSASRLPTADFCNELYESSYAASHVEVTQSNAESFALHLLKLLSSVAMPARVSLLDFGGNDGSMALTLASALLRKERVRSVQIVVIDHVPAAREMDPRIEITAVASLAALPAERRFNAVLASAVLEHIPHVAGVLEQLIARVAPDGWFYARTPWVAPLVRLWPRLPLMLWPVHIHDLGRPFWNRFAGAQPDFDTVHSRPSWVETSFRQAPARTAAAVLLKLPGQIDARLRPTYTGRWGWPLVGGWEVLLRRH